MTNEKQDGKSDVVTADLPGLRKAVRRSDLVHEVLIVSTVNGGVRGVREAIKGVVAPSASADSGEHAIAAVVDLKEKMVGKERIHPTKDVLAAVDMLWQKNSIEVEAVKLHPANENQQRFREQKFTREFIESIYCLQESDEFAEIALIEDASERVDKFYEKQDFSGGELTAKNLQVMHGAKNVNDLVFVEENGVFRRRRILELAAGDASISKTLMRTSLLSKTGPKTALEKFLISHMTRVLKNSPERFDGVKNIKDLSPQDFEQLREEVYQTAPEDLQKPDPFITSIDSNEKQVEGAKKIGINAMVANLCASPEAFFKATGIEPNSVDDIYLNLFLDRATDIHATVRLIQFLSRLDLKTRFVIGFYAPFSSKAISFSPGNVPEFDCFDPQKDFRGRWVGLDRTQTMYQIMIDLNLFGFNTQRVAEHEYEFYGVHCITRTAKELREDPKYAFLQTHDFKDEHLNARRDAVFNGKIPDDEIVGFPEREPLPLVAGHMTNPRDGSTLNLAA